MGESRSLVPKSPPAFSHGGLFAYFRGVQECHNAAVATTDAVESTLSLKRRETELLANQLEDAKAAATAAHAEAESLREQLRAAAGEYARHRSRSLVRARISRGSQRHALAGTADAPCPACPDVAAAPPAAVAPAPTASKKWLVIGMPSMPRENADYLNPTLDYILEQLPEDPLHPYFGRVLIVVMSNARGAPHPAFDTAKARLDPSQHPKGSFVHFVENGPQPDPLGDVKDAGSNDKPGYKVRQQTRDVAALLEYAGEMGKLYMFMEDDFRLCPLALRSLQYLVEKVDRLYPNWVMIRTGFGLNGGLIHASDTQFLAAYYREHQARRPPDHMLVEWFAGERPQSKEYVKDRKHIAYRYNLFEHIGFHSSLRSTKAERFAACYEELKYPTLFEVEAFKPECKHEDIWPCPSAVDEDHPMIDMVSVHRAVRRHGEHV